MSRVFLVLGVLLLAGAAVAVFLGEAHGQGGYYPGVNQGGYYQQPYYYPPPPPVYQKVVAQEIRAAPLIVTVPISSQAVPIHAYGASHYYSVQETYQQRAVMRDLVREELRNLLRQGGLDALPAQAPLAAQPKAPPAAVADVPQGKAGRKVTDLGKDTTTPAQLAQAVLQSFEKGTCLTCHSGNDPSGGLRLAYAEGKGYHLARQTRERRWMVYGQMSTGWMPPAARKDASKAAAPALLPPILQWTVEAN